MSTLLGYIETLDCCDGVQLFIAADDRERNYAAVLTGATKEADRYLVVGCNPKAHRCSFPELPT